MIKFFNDLSIRIKILGGAIATVLITVFLVSFTAYIFMRATLIKKFHEQAETAAQTLIASREVVKQKVKTYADILSRRQDIINTVARKDEATLERLLVSEYKAIHEKDETIRTVEVTDDRGIVIMRGHNPKKKGDDKSMLPMIQHALSGEPQAGLQVSPTTGEMAYDAVYPLKLGDKVVGTIKVGSYFKEETAVYLKNIANVDVIFFSGNKVNVSTLKEASDLTITDDLLRNLKPKQALYDTIVIKGRKYHISYIPLIDPEGRTRGAMAGLISYEGLEKSLSDLVKSLIVIAITTSILLILPGFVIVNRFVKQLLLIAHGIDRVSEGDLRVRIPHYKGKDEIGLITRKMNMLIDNFNDIINKLLIAANNVVSTVEVLGAKAQNTADGAKDQSFKAHQIAVAAEEMSQTIADIAQNAKASSDTAEDAMKIAYEGKNIADEAVNTMNSVHTSTLELATLVEKLNKRAQEIGDIVTVIKDIADQINLLALNASIEAARAGEHGRGFAVVADEIKKLANRTIQATGEISEKISAIQSESTQTANSMTKASTEITKATEDIRKVGESLTHIVGAVQRVKDQITQIAVAVGQQAVASDEVAKNIEKISTISKDIKKMADEVMEEVNILTKISDELRNSTSRFITK